MHEAPVPGRDWTLSLSSDTGTSTYSGGVFCRDPSLCTTYGQSSFQMISARPVSRPSTQSSEPGRGRPHRYTRYVCLPSGELHQLPCPAFWSFSSGCAYDEMSGLQGCSSYG